MVSLLLWLSIWCLSSSKNYSKSSKFYISNGNDQRDIIFRKNYTSILCRHNRDIQCYHHECWYERRLHACSLDSIQLSLQSCRTHHIWLGLRLLQRCVCVALDAMCGQSRQHPDAWAAIWNIPNYHVNQVFSLFTLIV